MSSSIVERALIVGGGIGGMCAALCLRKLGARVELVELDPAWKVYGAGIHLVGAGLRAFEDLGLLAQIRQHGYLAGDLTLHPIDGRVGFRHQAPSEATIDADGGIMRPALHSVLSAATLEAGVEVYLGVSVAQLTESAQRASVLLTDGRRADYDLVIAADGVGSRLRRMLFPEVPAPQFMGQGSWRLVAERPASVTCTAIYVGAPHVVGFVPVSQTHMYMFLLQNLQDNVRMECSEQPARLRALLQGFGGIAETVREHIGPHSQIVYRPLEALLVPRPWSRGRVLLLGDAAHTTTPHLAMGAGMAVEDAVVLGQELAKASDVPAALAAHEERRFERCRLVVENAAQIGRYQRERATPDKAFSLLTASMAQLAQPY